MKDYFNSKNILFICPKFYEYHKYIIDKLKSNGFIVTFYRDPSEEYFFYKLIKKVKSLHKFYIKYQQSKLLKILSRNKIDYLFVIRGEVLTIDFMKIVNTNFDIKSILYEWDSLKNFNYSNIVSYFDRVLTFDYEDSNSHMKYLPLFYSRKYTYNNKEIEDYDLVFFGVFNNQRYEIINKIERIACQNNISFYFYLYYPLNYYILHFIKTWDLSFLKKVSFLKMNYTKVLDFLKRSNCVLDIHQTGQTGLTMRTIESLALNKKILTTNKFIKNESIYDSNSIRVFSKEDKEIDLKFIKERIKINRAMTKYSIENWLKEIFDNKVIIN